MEQQRYKKRGLQFNSSLDSRALRAVQYQERRKSRRNDVLALRRQMDCLEDSMDKCRPSQSISTLSEEADENKIRKTRKELGLERYKQLLKWKEQKKKQVEKEKRKRRPSFKTGVFQPDPPKFLVSGETNDMGKSLNQTPGKATPFKFSVSSSKKFGTTLGTSMRKNPVFHTGVTPGTSMQRIPKFHTGVTPGTSTQKIPQFHTGVTPKETLKRDRILHENICSKKETEKSEKKENYAPPRTRAMLKRTAKSEHHLAETRKVQGYMTRRRKVVDRQDDLGVKPLPATPQPSRASLLRERRVEAPQSSDAHVSTFAPSNFDFNFDMSKVSLRRDFLQEENTGFDSHSAADTQTDRCSTRFLKSALDCDSSDQTSSSAVSECGKISCDPQPEVTLEAENKVSTERDILECEDTITTEVDRIVTENETGKKEDEELKDCIIEEQAGKESTENELKTSCAGGLNDIEYLDKENMNTSGNTKAEGGVTVDEDKEIALESIAEGECTNFDSEDNHAAQNSDEQADESKRRISVATPAKCRTRKSTSCCDVTPSMSRLRPRTPCSRKTRRSLSAHCDPPERITKSVKKTSRKSSCRSGNDAVKLNNVSEVLSEKYVNKFSLFESEGSNKVLISEPSKKNWKQMHGVNEDTTTEDQEQFKTPDGVKKLEEAKSELTSMPVDLEHSSVLLTPNSSGHQTKVSWMVDASPWINKSRRSLKKRHSCATPDFQKLPDDIFVEGSPYLAHKMSENVGPRKYDDPPVVDRENKNSPKIDESKVAEDQSCMKLLPLLEPSSLSCHTASPDIDVWGEVSPAVSSSVNDCTTEVPVTSRNIIPKNLTTLSAQTTTKIPTPTILTSSHKMLATPSVLDASLECNENEEPFDPNQPPNSILPGKSATRKRKSRRSVMFSLQEQENDATPTFRFPGTPIRASSRVSMGLYSKVDVNTDSIFPWDQNLIDLDSPKSERKTAATRRKSSRVNLLPGLNSSPIAVQESPVSQDLIGWDTPMAPKKRNSRSAVSSLATPIRRSQRLSKAPAL